MKIGPPWKDFAHWFEAQFGKDPADRVEIVDLCNSVASARIAVADLEDLLKRKTEYIIKRDAALKAWCIKDLDKP